MQDIEPNIMMILAKALYMGPSDKESAERFIQAVESLQKRREYYQTQMLDGSGSAFMLQPCDLSGRPTVGRFSFSYGCLRQ
jgi:hypothetical protein